MIFMICRVLSMTISSLFFVSIALLRYWLSMGLQARINFVSIIAIFKSISLERSVIPS